MWSHFKSVFFLTYHNGLLNENKYSVHSYKGIFWYETKRKVVVFSALFSMSCSSCICCFAFLN